MELDFLKKKKKNMLVLRTAHFQPSDSFKPVKGFRLQKTPFQDVK